MGNRVSVFLGFAFGALLLVLALSAYAIRRSSQEAQRHITGLHVANLQAADAFGRVRANIFMNGILVRDFMLDSEGSAERDYEEQSRALRERVYHDFDILEAAARDTQAQEGPAISRLRQQVAEHLDPNSVLSAIHRHVGKLELLEARARQRERILSLTAELERLVAGNFDAQADRVAEANERFQRSLGLIAGIALIVGLAIATFSLYRFRALEAASEEAKSELRRLAVQLRSSQETERKRLARELHDEVGQTLTGIRMELAGAERITPGGEVDLRNRISQAKSLVERTLRGVRDIVMFLRPSMLDDLGLSPAISWLARELSRSSGMEIVATVDSVLDTLPDAHRTCLYRVVQECLTNAVRHSGAARVDVIVEARPPGVCATVTDNGRGFTPSEHAGGLGIVGMEERVRELGGQLRVTSAPGQGTRIEASLPSAA